MDNCTGLGKVTSTLRFACTLPKVLAVFFVVLNTFLSITASLSNALILIALRKVSSVHPPTKLLFRCLAVSDLCVGLITQPLYVTIMLNSVTMMSSRNVLYYVMVIENASSLILCPISVFTSTAISMDRLLALLLGLRYRNVVTLRRVCALIICFWLTGFSIVFMNIFFDGGIAIFVAIGFITLSAVVSTFSYAKIFLTLRQRQAQVQDVNQGQSSGGGIALNIVRYKKTVSTIAWVQLALVVCYVPPIISSMAIMVNRWIEMSAGIVWISTGILLYLNSSINPILYCWKIKEIRQEVKDTMRLFYCSSC